MFKVLLTAFLTTLLCACVTSYSPQSLRKSSGAECITLERSYSWKVSRGLGYTFEEGLRAGEYRSLYEDHDGVFFAGVGQTVFRAPLATKNGENGNIQDTKRFNQEGGIWVPKNPHKRPKTYTIVKLNNSAGDSNNASGSIAMNHSASAGVAPSALGGAVAGSIIEALHNAEDGKFYLWPEIEDTSLLHAIRDHSSCTTANVSPNLQ